MPNIPTLDGLDNAQLGHITNGCGGIGIFNVPDWIFFSACQQHDLAYWVGCNEDDRYQADLAFYCNMKSLVAKQPWYKRWFYYGLAYTYYKSVRVFTVKFFYFGPTKRTFDDLATEMGVTSPVITTPEIEPVAAPPAVKPTTEKPSASPTIDPKLD